MGWIHGGTIDTLAVHAALLPSGKIIYFGGSDYNPDNFRRGLINHTRLYDCATLAITSVGSPTTDTFCCGHALMEGGRLLIAGGTESYPAAIGYHHDHWPGVPDAWIFDANSGTWSHVAAMDGGRWYPTLVTSADGRVLAMSGHPSGGDIGRHINNTPEIFVPDENRWILRNALGYEGRQNNPRTGDPGFQVQYPRLHVLPNGDVFCVTPLYENEPSSVRYNPDTQVHSFVGGINSDPDFLPAALVAGHNATSVLLPFLRSNGYRSSVLLCGSNRPLRIDFDSPTPRWRPTGPRTLPESPARYNLNAVLLPTGDVFVTGGIADGATKSDRSGVLTPELYHPETDQWETLERDEVVRNYHSVALLMPDGRVWTAGSNKDGAPSHDGVDGDTHEPRIQIYEPWYHFRPRPRITASPPGLPYRSAASNVYPSRIRTPEANRIKRVVLIRTGSATHAFNSDQRYVELEFNLGGADELEVIPPDPGGIAPVGDYLLFIVDENNVPSVGSFVWVGYGPPYVGGGPAQVRQPFTIHNQDGRIELFAIGEDGAVWHRWQTEPNGPFAEWHSLGGNVSQPFAIRNQDGRIELFAIGATTDRALWHRWQTAPNGPFADWHSLGGDLSQPFAIHNQDGRIEVFAIGTDGAVWHRWQTEPNGPFAEWHRLV